ncbi:hypothetical protein [Paenibacillus xylaniclasticus]|uniref:hypothetical protein n=1 Tax=Paenibacillus xylaniclasticus TaxID=588083 RepID=UPI000FD9777B|nr:MULTISPECIES: hypothetical protein [Paenibacillus]GFN32981.1 hypothetical protein PCURB6_32410 [Paenibacillus curdlanolyticus]
MLDFITDYRWYFLLIAEGVFWITLLTAIVLKYWFDQSKAAFFTFVITLVNELWILFLGIVDVNQMSQLSGFQIIIVIILLYTLFFGKHQLKRVDRFLSRMVARIKKMPPPVHKDAVKYGKDKAIEEFKQFGLHVIMFLTAHAIFYAFLYFGNRDQFPALFGQWIPWLREQFQLNEALVQMNKIWSALLLLDAVISISYLIFPKKSDELKNLDS